MTDNLHTVFRRAVCHDEKIVVIMDEFNVLDSAFLERMSILLANGEVRREGGEGGGKRVKV